MYYSKENSRSIVSGGVQSSMDSSSSSRVHVGQLEQSKTVAVLGLSDAVISHLLNTLLFRRRRRRDRCLYWASLNCVYCVRCILQEKSRCATWCIYKWGKWGIYILP